LTGFARITWFEFNERLGGVDVAEAFAGSEVRRVRLAPNGSPDPAKSKVVANSPQ
jgi:hypothetical protein